jgi:predicted PurR-regulated permease PerM
MTDARPDYPKITLGVIAIGGLILTSLWILRPFLGATIWAAMVVVATWPVLLWMQARLWNRRSLAVAAMVITLLLLFVLPLTLAISTIADNGDAIVNGTKTLIDRGAPRLPDWIVQLPLVGPKIATAWNELVASGVAGLQAKLMPYAKSATGWLLAQAGVVTALSLQFILTVVIAAVMYANGEDAAQVVRRFGKRIGGVRGEDAVILAGKAIRAVALGVGVTATAQAVAAGIGLAIAGVPFATLLTAVIFIFCVVQVGPVLVLAPAVGWLFYTGATGWAIFLLVWTLIVGTMDNFLRPFLIKRSADLPLLLIFAGVIGGLLGFGLVGIFVGPVMLAVSYTLIDAWLVEGEPG